jgi:class 3 adenylate cyclase
MTQHGNSPSFCSVVFIDIVEYSKVSVGDQMQLTARFNALLEKALTHLRVEDRIVLDTGSGVVVTFLDGPEEAFLFALALHASPEGDRNDGALPLRIGINLGPVRLVTDADGQPNIIGDGIDVAQQVMRFADVGQVLASRGYVEALADVSVESGASFTFDGVRTDPQVREHDVFALSRHPVTDLPARLESLRASAHPRGQIWRRPPVATALVVALIVITAIFVRLVVLVPDDVPVPAVTQAAAVPEEARLSAEAAPAARSVMLRVNVLPWGDIRVDGVEYGAAPPQREVALSPGMHVLEIRNPAFPPHRREFEVSAGQEIRIRHEFR